MKKNTYVMLMIVCFIASIILVPSIASAKSYKQMKGVVSLDMPPDSGESIAVTDLLDSISKATDGIITFEIHYSGELYNVINAVQACSTGAIQATQAATYALERYVPAYGIFNVPLLFDDNEHTYRFLDSQAWREPLVKKLRKNGLVPMPAASSFPLRFAGKFKVNQLADLKGKEFRVMPSPIMVKGAKAVGAKPIQVATSELTVAMQTGMMDCLLMGSDAGVMGFFGYHRYMPVAIKRPGYNYMTAELVFNADWWDRIPGELKNKIENDVLPAWLERARKNLVKTNRDDAEKFMDENFEQTYNISPGLLKEWRAALAPLRKEQAEKLGQLLFDTVEKVR
jgi:TRAP-type C4-dicarboxylate transport system substrate-binding protein